jgi:hypothetical protein
MVGLLGLMGWGWRNTDWDIGMYGMTGTGMSGDWTGMVGLLGWRNTDWDSGIIGIDGIGINGTGIVGCRDEWDV